MRYALSGRSKPTNNNSSLPQFEEEAQKNTQNKEKKKKNSYIVSAIGRRPPKHIAGHEVVDLEKMKREEERKPKYVHDEKENPFLYEDKDAEKRIQKNLGLPFPKEMRPPYEKRDAFLPLE
jgi:hypothetical protein